MKNFSQIAESMSPSATLALNAKALELKAGGCDVINLSVGEPDFSSPQIVKNAGIRAIEEDFTRYTAEAGVKELREAVASYYGKEYGLLNIAKDNVIVSNGGKQILAMIFAILLNPGEEVIIPAPYWTSYPEQIRLAGGVPIIVPADERFIARADVIEKAISKRTKAVILNSPSNPTGAIIPDDEVQKIVKIAEHHDIFIISDEVYSELYFTDKKPLSSAIFEKKPLTHVIIASSVSKIAAMTGWRIGYAIADVSVIKKLAIIQSHLSSAPCSISQKAAISAFSEQALAYAAFMRLEFRKRRDIAVECFKEIPQITVIPPSGAFYLFCRISNNLFELTEGKFCEELLDKEGVVVVPGEAFGNDYLRWFRLSLAADEAKLKQGIRRIKGFIGSV